MAQPYVGEIRMFGGDYAPAGWMFCNGALLPISGNEALFNLIGTTYGGDGQSTFALPDLRGRVPVHQGNGFTLAEMAGVEDVTLTTPEIPMHTHALQGSSGTANSPNASNNVLARSPQVKAFINGSPTIAMASQFLAPYLGGSQPHTNIQPYLCISFIISLYGVYPST